MTGDARPITQFRIAPFIKTDSLGDMGCFNSAFSLNTRTENFVSFDTSLVEYTSALTSNTIEVPYFQFPMQTINTTFCQTFVPCGNFSWNTDTLCPEPCYTFNENSYLADNWEWVFENGVPNASNNQVPPPVCYTQPGPHEVTLTISNQYGAATYTQSINPDLECPFVVPNIFTPNGDGINDTWHATGLYETFSLNIFNRWGMEIFASDVPGSWWDGNSGGDAVSEGVYFYILYLPESDRVFKGTIELIR